MYKHIDGYAKKAKAILDLVAEMDKPNKSVLTNKEIGALFGVSTATVWRIRSNQGRLDSIATETLSKNNKEEPNYYVNNLIMQHWPATDLEITRKYQESQGIYYTP
jgi:hypothetical protein